MNNKKDDNYYIKKVIENIDAIILYFDNKSYKDFINDFMLIDATMFRLIQMVENINHLSEEYKLNHSEIEWKKIIGFRNGIVHDYGKTDYTIIYDIVTKDIIKLKNILQKSLP